MEYRLWFKGAAPEPAEQAAFDQWLTANSFSMLAPMCRVGLAVVAVMLLLVDPALHAAGIWGGDPQHFYLVLWHISAAAGFASFLVARQFGTSHASRSRILKAFFVTCAVLFSWFAFISWMLNGDLSTYAIFLLTMVCVFCHSGQLRKGLIVGSTIAIAVAVFYFDSRDTFHTSGAAINLVALAIVALLLDSFVLRLNLALFREKRLVEFERARADRVLYNALPVSIADELKNNNVVKAEKFPEMAVLFVDIAGFTRFSATRAPDEVVQVLNELFSEFDQLVDQYGVEKIKTIGDAYMVVGKRNLRGVVRLATEFLVAVENYNRRRQFNLAIRCGVHVGPTVAGVIGLKRFLYDVWGDAVNVASRMESTGIPGRVQVSEDVYRQLGGEFEFESRGEIDIRGKGPMHTYLLVATRPAAITPSVVKTWADGSSGTPSGRPESGGCAG